MTATGRPSYLSTTYWACILSIGTWKNMQVSRHNVMLVSKYYDTKKLASCSPNVVVFPHLLSITIKIGVIPRFTSHATSSCRKHAQFRSECRFRQYKSARDTQIKRSRTGTRRAVSQQLLRQKTSAQNEMPLHPMVTLTKVKHMWGRI
jgi:hypothetical protein